MRKLLLLSLAAVLAAAVPGVASAQGVGVKGGFTLSEIRGDTGDPGVSYGRLRGWSAGAYFSLGWGPVSLQPEVLYTRRGAEVEDLNPGETTLRMDYIEVPLLLRIGTPSIGVYGGGYGAARMGAKLITVAGDQRTELDIASSVERFDYGVVFGAMLRFGSVGLDGRYSLGMRELFRPVGDLPAPDLKHAAWTLFLTIDF